MSTLSVQNLSVNIEDKPILDNFSLEVPSGEVHAIMGPKWKWEKHPIEKALAGHPGYKVTSGTAKLNDTNFIGMEPDEISRIGLFSSIPISYRSSWCKHCEFHSCCSSI